MLISHRNHISVFDMIEKTWLHCMHSFRKAEFVRMMAVKKLPKDARGKTKRNKNMQEHQKQIQSVFKKYHIVVVTTMN